MRFILFTTKSDRSANILVKEARRISLACQVYYYADLFFENGEVFSTNNKPLSVKKSDKIILRDPYNSNNNYSLLFQNILEKYYANVSLDRDCYSEFPQYEDKLFQFDLLRELSVGTPETKLAIENIDSQQFPLIIKPRIGSRGRGIRVLENLEAMRKFSEKKNLHNYIIQRYYKTENEYRILLLNHNILGVVDKSIYLKDKGRVGVKINKVVHSLPTRVMEDSRKITKNLKADFAGIDVMQTEDQKYYFLEVNLSPQFGGFMKATKINVGRKIIGEVLLHNSVS